MNAPVKLTDKDFATDQEVRWCPGCGDYAILKTIQKLMPTLDVPKEDLVFVSGIGCSSRFHYYMETYGFHTIHGRALSIATGAKIANPNLDIWTLTIRRGVLWADGEAFDADDVEMTINLLLNDESQSLNDAANMQQWVDSVQKIDDLTVQFNLREPNPRFQLDYFSVRVGGSIVILPEHVWKGQDPFTFDFYEPKKGWPLGTGPYQLVKASENEFVYDRYETWWGTKVGFKDMPIPKINMCILR